MYNQSICNQSIYNPKISYSSYNQSICNKKTIYNHSIVEPVFNPNINETCIRPSNPDISKTCINNNNNNNNTLQLIKDLDTFDCTSDFISGVSLNLNNQNYCESFHDQNSLKHCIMKSFIYLQSFSKSKKSYTNIVTNRRVEAEMIAYTNRFSSFTLNNIFSHYSKINSRFAYADDRGRIKMLTTQIDKSKPHFNAVIIFHNKQIKIITVKKIKQALNFESKSRGGGICNFCGLICVNKKLHCMQYCKVKSSTLSVSTKITDKTSVHKIIDSLQLKEDRSNAEPSIFLKKNIEYEESSVIKIKSIKSTKLALFQVYYIYSFLQKNSAKGKRLKHIVSTAQFENTFNTFLQKFNQINLSNLELFFRIQVKFYFKSDSSNRLLPIQQNRKHEMKCFIGFIIDDKIIIPRSQPQRHVRVCGTRSSFCSKCGIFVSSMYKHASRCVTKCRRCLTDCNAKNKNPNKGLLTCIKCNLVFLTMQCYLTHLSTTCMRIYKCKICLAYINKYVDRHKHLCNKRVCSTCRATIPVNEVDHQCLIVRPSLKKNRRNIACVFFDIEAFLNPSGVFVPCLISYEVVCDACSNPEKVNNNETCTTCFNYKNTILGEDCIPTFVKFLLNLKLQYKNIGTIAVISHCGGKFDNVYVYGYLLSNLQLLTSPPLLKGNKILMLKCSRKIKFYDSYNFLPISLRRFHKSFNIPEQKGFFPHRWLDREKFLTNKLLPFPTYDQFNSNELSIDDYNIMKAKYSNSQGLFSVRNMLSEYCQMDVKLLLLGFESFIKVVYQKLKMHPLDFSITLSSLAFKGFALHYMDPELRNLDTSTLLANNSRGQIEWLYNIKCLIPNNLRLVTASETQTDLNIFCGGKRFCPDGILLDSNNTILAIFEYFGCYIHNHIIGPDFKPCPLNTEKNDPQKFFDTKKRAREISKFYPIYTIYECQWKSIKARSTKIKKICNEFKASFIHNQLCSRNAVYGGRTETYKRFYKIKSGQEVLKWLDIVSLYPSVQKSGNFATGRLYSQYGRFVPSISRFLEILNERPNSGLALVSIEAPRNLYFPILPVKIQGTLIFCLCTKCAETFQYPCNHTLEERLITGTYTYPELKKAVDSGYKIHKIYETLFCKKTCKLFEQCINTIAGLKIAYSGFPPHVKTDKEKDEYVQKFKDHGIELSRQDMAQNGAQKLIWKLYLNSIWGRFALNSTKYKELGLVSDMDQLADIINGDGPHQIEELVNDINSDTVLYTYTSNKIRKSRSTNLMTAAYVCSLARLQLLKKLESIGPKHILYADTDSVLYISSPSEGKQADEGEMLGQWTCELTNTLGEDYEAIEFVSCAPKTYAIKARNKKTGEYKYICKMKGITLEKSNAENDFNKIKKIVFENDCSVPIAVQQFKVEPRGNGVSLQNFVKLLRDSSFKRYVLPGKIETLPWGFID